MAQCLLISSRSGASEGLRALFEFDQLFEIGSTFGTTGEVSYYVAETREELEFLGSREPNNEETHEWVV